MRGHVCSMQNPQPAPPATAPLTALLKFSRLPSNLGFKRVPFLLKGVYKGTETPKKGIRVLLGILLLVVRTTGAFDDLGINIGSQYARKLHVSNFQGETLNPKP